MIKNKKLVSLIQPTGQIHLENYLGAVKNWVSLQNTYNCRFGIADYHSLTSLSTDRSRVHNMIFELVACGINTKNIFVQSLIPEVMELNWILNCFTPFGDLTRQTQFKSKSESSFISSGLFTYPVLQAADILIQKADYVPVGKDQIQHIELTRGIAQRFNSHYNTNVFNLPDVLLSDSPSIKSLSDPHRKMSKSLGDKHFLSLFEDLGSIKNKIKSAVTSSGSTASEGVFNLLTILKSLDYIQEYERFSSDILNGSIKYSELKDVLYKAVAEHREVIIDRFDTIDKDKVIEEVKYNSAIIRDESKIVIEEIKSIIKI